MGSDPSHEKRAPIKSIRTETPRPSMTSDVLKFINLISRLLIRMCLQQSLNSIKHRLSPNAKYLNLHLLDTLDRAHRAYVRIRALARKKLSNPGRLETRFAIFPSWKCASASSEDGLFAGFEGGVGYEEDELVAVRGRRGHHGPVNVVVSDL